MCGLVSYFAKESVPPIKYFDMLFTAAENRGTDGVGVTIVKRPSKEEVSFKNVKYYSECKDEVLAFIEHNLKLHDVLIGLCRAAPEQEPPSSETNMQPISNLNCVLVHNGAISQAIYNEIKTESEVAGNEYVTEIDSEAIVHAYKLAQWDIQKSMQRISGGVAAIMYDRNKDCLLLCNDFKPTAQAYVKGYGYFLTSETNVLDDIIQDITNCTRNGIALWENFYSHYLTGARIKLLDLDSGFVSNIKYRPRYITQHWDSSNPTKGELCLVASSGGLDSTMTLSMLKLAGYDNIVACHFKYGHRGQAAELAAITSVTEKLNIKLKVFDIENLMKGIDPTSMLIDENAEITTGTTAGLKTVHAWTCGRNMNFLTLMATYAEAQVMKHDYETVHLLGGFCNLTESGHYSDNSEYFLDAALNLFKYGTLIGDRIKPLYGLSNLMKSDQFALIEAFKLHAIYHDTISCDRPEMKYRDLDDGTIWPDRDDVLKAHNAERIACNCSKNGMPACGSGLLSYWASKMIGMDDMAMRNFYEVEEDYVPHKPKHMDSGKQLTKDIHNIIDRILIPDDRREQLRNVYIDLHE